MQPLSAPADAPSNTGGVPRNVRLRRAGAGLAIAGVMFALLYVKAIPCVFAQLFHTPCPGCGSTRAVIALLHGDLHGVVRFNPLGPVMATILGVFALQALVSVLTHGDFRDVGSGRLGKALKAGVGIVVALAFALWIARFFGAFGGPVPV